MKYRTRLDIMATILRVAMRGASRTRLMYGAYLSYAQLKDYISFLQDKELLVYDESMHIYRLTEKALKFLSVYDEFNDLLSLEAEKSIPSKQEHALLE